MKMRSAITVSLVPEATGGPFVFWNGLEDACCTASRLGFDAIEIFPPNADAIDLDELRRFLCEFRLGVAAVGSGGGWVIHRWTLTHANPAIRVAAREFIRGIIDLAASLGAPAILGSMQGKAEGDISRDQALSWLGEALEDLGEHAGKLGQVFLYEPLNRYETNLLNRLGQTAEWLGTLRTRNIRILADLFHMNIEETDSALAIRQIGLLIGHLHFADSNRQAMGFGQTNSGKIYTELDRVGYSGFLSAEILPLPNSLAAAEQSIHAFNNFTSPRPDA
jgi:sugar phosphate isomerase/epimerase